MGQPLVEGIAPKPAAAARFDFGGSAVDRPTGARLDRQALGHESRLGAASGVRSGTVVDLLSGQPLPGATVRWVFEGPGADVEGPPAGVEEDGTYRLSVPAGATHLRASAPGYTSSSLPLRLADEPGQSPRPGDFRLPPAEADPGVSAEVVRRLTRVSRRSEWSRARPLRSGARIASLDEDRVPAEIRVLMPDGAIVAMETDEYLRGVVPAEMGYVFRRNIEALKAQAIASRTYASIACLPESAGDPSRCERGIDANVDTTTRTQVWRPEYFEPTDQAVRDTSGMAVVDANGFVATLYFARTADRTLDSEMSPCCGGRAWPYLRSVASPDAFDRRFGHGAGMSQEGAAVFADWGATAEEILTHYYTGAQVAHRPAETTGRTAENQPIQPVMRSGLAPGHRAAVHSVAMNRAAGGWLGPVVSGVDFVAAAISWMPTDRCPSAEPEARYRDGSQWSSWERIEADPDGLAADPRGRIWGRLLVADGDAVQVRFPALACPSGGHNGSLAPPVEDVQVELIDTRANERDAAITQANGRTGLAAPPVAGIDLISRAEWGADESLRLDDQGQEIWPAQYTTPRASVIHHTVTANDPEDPAAVVRAIYHYHAVSRGWGDIGYNLLVDHLGRVYEGRFGGGQGDRVVQGGHALQYNSHTIGIAVLGTFTESSQQPAADAWDSLVEVLARAGLQYGIRPSEPVSLAGTEFQSRVLGHRDVLPGHTECPGQGVHGRLASLRHAVQSRMAAIGQATVTPTRAGTDPPPRPGTATPTVPSEPPGGCVELIRHGDFETVSSHWIRNRANYTGWDVYAGEQAMFVGLTDQDPDATQTWASVSQTIDVPPDAVGGRLRFAAKSQGAESDRRMVRFLTADGGTAGLGEASLPAMSPWTTYDWDVTQDLTPHVGQSVRLYFGVINDGDGTRSHIRLDSVSLVACGGAVPPTSTPGHPMTTTPTEPRATSTPASPAPNTPATPTSTPVPVTSTPTPRPPEPFLECGYVELPTLAKWKQTGNHPVQFELAGGPSGGPAAGLGPLDAGGFGYAALSLPLRLPGDPVSATLSFSARLDGGDAPRAAVVEVREPAVGRRRVIAGPAPTDLSEDWARFNVALESPEALRGELYVAAMNHGTAGEPAARTWLADAKLNGCWLRLHRAFVPRVLSQSR